jgi:protein-L-isoaspartate(D-aspartate) O-methyltransferase
MKKDTKPDEVLRKQMVDSQIVSRGVSNKAVIAAMQDVPRHIFASDHELTTAYQDSPLPIGFGQTISQPYIVAFMTEAAGLSSRDKVLEIGTGSAYQAAILSKIVDHVYSVEIIEELGEKAEKTLKDNGFNNISIKIGNGYLGWQEQAPFDAIIVTAAPEKVPQALLDQLKIGGRLIIPVGTVFQQLIRITKTSDGFKQEDLFPVRFVPMTGKPQS